MKKGGKEEGAEKRGWDTENRIGSLLSLTLLSLFLSYCQGEVKGENFKEGEEVKAMRE